MGLTPSIPRPSVEHIGGSSLEEKLLDVIDKTLDQNDINYLKAPAVRSIPWTADQELSFVIVVAVQGPIILCSIPYSGNVPVASRRPMIEFTIRANYGLNVGAFGLNIETGDLRYVASHTVLGGTWPDLPAFLIKGFQHTRHVFQRYHKGIKTICANPHADVVGLIKEAESSPVTDAVVAALAAAFGIDLSGSTPTTPQSAIKTVDDFLDQNNLVYVKTTVLNSDIRAIDFRDAVEYGGESKSIRVIIRHDPQRERVRITVRWNMGDVPADRRSDVVMFITMANYALPIGCWDMDLNDGELSFRVCYMYVHTPLETFKNIVPTLFGECLSTYRKYYPGLANVIKNGASPEEEIKNIEHDAGSDVLRALLELLARPSAPGKSKPKKLQERSGTVCTFQETARAFYDQPFYKCKTCTSKPGIGVCYVCKDRCHLGHDLELSKPTSCFCDCGAGDLPEPCRCLEPNWRCENCTVINKVCDIRCQTCNAEKPTDAPLMVSRDLSQYYGRSEPATQVARTSRAPRSFSSSADQKHPAHVIPRSQIEFKRSDVLGKGGMGSVYKGRYCASPVAIKEVNAEMAHDQGARDIFMAEIALQSQCHHPRVCQVLGVCTDDDSKQFLMVQEYCALGSVHHVLRNEELKPQLTLLRRLRMAIEAAQGMAFLHGRGIAHFDLKPLNLLCDENMAVKVCDFGLAKTMKATNTVSAHGFTPIYVAPEMLHGEPVGREADVFAFGMVLFELVTLEQPYYDLNVPMAAIITRCALGELPHVPPGVDPRLVQLMTACWQRQPNKRPSFEKIVYTLEAIRSSLKK